MIRKIAVPLLFFALVALLCACGVSAVTVVDCEESTEYEYRGKKDAEEILEELGVEVSEVDWVVDEPAEGLSGRVVRILRNRPLTLVEDGKKVDVVLHGGTVSDAIRLSGLAFGDDYECNYPLDLSVYSVDGEITLAKKLAATVKIDGKTLEFLTTARTVEELFEKEGLVLDKYDACEPSRDAPITDGITITVRRGESRTVTEKIELDYETDYENTSSLTRGSSQVKTYGQKGEKEIVYEVILLEGKEISRKQVSEKITKEPVNEVVLVGTAEPQTRAPARTSSGGKTVVSRERCDDCDGSGHGYWVITYSDGTEDYIDY